ncbi:hypothetical protein EMIT0196P_50142 [Pseudomonas chlororaphis]
MAQPQGLAGLRRRHGRLCRQWRGAAGVAVRAGVLRDLLPVDRLLGLRRDFSAPVPEQPEGHASVQPQHGGAAGGERGVSVVALSIGVGFVAACQAFRVVAIAGKSDRRPLAPTEAGEAVCGA